MNKIIIDNKNRKIPDIQYETGKFYKERRCLGKTAQNQTSEYIFFRKQVLKETKNENN